MKQTSVISATILSLLLGATTLATAQHDQQGPGNDRGNPRPAQQSRQARPAQQSRPQQGARPAQNQARPQQSYGGAFHGGVQANGPTYGGVHHSGVPQHQGQVQDGFLQSRAGSWKNEHQSWRQRGLFQRGFSNG